MSCPCDYGHCDPKRCSRTSECDEQVFGPDKAKLPLLASLLSMQSCPIEIISNLLIS
jgi:hypothetical protein